MQNNKLSDVNSKSGSELIAIAHGIAANFESPATELLRELASRLECAIVRGDELAVSWYMVGEFGEPDLPVGESKSYWVCYRSNGDQKLRVSQAVWFNQSKPEGLDEDDDGDCELYTPDGEPYWPVGWHEAYCHEDFSTYYLGWDCGQILAYAELKLPQIPVQLLSGTHDAAKDGE
ncbi:hypothetical protein [Pantoea sp. V106_11]|uniref:hypothetical protein n=1 Tax=Pantoea sp. V106_11 TaxID=3044234 RepID=UPI00249EC221|nr:hypothetical protein [Pantoea sp. V106_11]MDI3415676.1 hypothetical protein [Pantoea sp. V106_11]